MKLLIFGGSGLVGSKFLELNKDKYWLDAPYISEVDILDKNQLVSCFEKSQPQTVINFAAFTDVQGAEGQKGLKEGKCYQINAIGAKNVADCCKDGNVHLIHISTDYVFDGKKKDCPYREDDKPNPINWYGETKHFGDQFVLESGCLSTIVRISMPYSAKYEAKLDVARFFLSELKAGNQIKAIEDQRITPTLVEDIANALKQVVNQKKTGVYHVSSKTYTSPLEFANLLARTFSLDSTLIQPILLDEYNKNKLAPLLKYSWLDPSKFVAEFGEGVLHTVEEAVVLFKQKIEKG